ncbi:unnamed protein product [Nippostrongylus brasiliensis]|uniref:serine--tRNA ligase n=1 Tax=Nippostrongylus brasiliensis TaxID=27835 RepID=A0A0N4YHJ9_NIPBR|nr:unnamed protein product [Nippostrongylus brasiliensis]
MKRALSAALGLRRGLKLAPLSTHLRTQCLSSVSRPELDFDYLLDDQNLEKIKQNIIERKGVGDIDAVRTKWKELHALMDAKEKPKLSETELKAMWDDLYNEALRIPNTSSPDVPKGGMENAKVMATWGTKREDDCLTAEKLVQSWRTLFFPTDASGERSYAFVGAIANLERALLEYVFDRVCVLGFTPLSVPDLVSKEITEASEMGISAFLKDRTFREEELPLRVVALSRCYRPEISNSAAEAKLYRVHEFTKVEMYTMCTPEQSAQEFDYLVSIQKGTFESLGIHCR